VSGGVEIVRATPDDVPLIFSLIRELAEYERAPEAVTGTPAMLEQALFGAQPVVEALIGFVDGEAAGFALYYTTFSTWLCRAGVWLEDLFVRPSARRAGLGRALLSAVARVTVERGGQRLEWAALDWNELALGFYRGLGAEVLSEWQMHRLTGDALAALAAAPER
jgi:GNAT superfamily N-acetyltransferase